MSQTFELQVEGKRAVSLSLDELRRGWISGRVPQNATARTVGPWQPMASLAGWAFVGDVTFFVRTEDQEVGPVTSDQVRRGVDAGEIPSGSEIRALGPWQPVSSLVGFDCGADGASRVPAVRPDVPKQPIASSWQPGSPPSAVQEGAVTPGASQEKQKATWANGLYALFVLLGVTGGWRYIPQLFSIDGDYVGNATIPGGMVGAGLRVRLSLKDNKWQLHIPEIGSGAWSGDYVVNGGELRLNSSFFKDSGLICRIGSFNRALSCDGMTEGRRDFGGTAPSFNVERQ